jgi:two-component system, chemotaxis family, chemotaxis protein CheY
MSVLKILLVDDSATVRKVIRYQLMVHGCRDFSEADHPSQALELLVKERHQLVTMDLMMPTFGGISTEEAFAAMRGECPDTAIVIVTSMAYEKLKLHYLQKGALAYVVKPFTRFAFEELRRKLGPIFAQFR